MLHSIGFSDAEEFFAQTKDELENEASMLKSLHLIENSLQSKGRELSRYLLQGYLNNCGDGDIGSEVITSTNIKLTHKRFRSRKIHSRIKFFFKKLYPRILLWNRSVTSSWLLNTRTSKYISYGCFS